MEAVMPQRFFSFQYFTNDGDVLACTFKRAVVGNAMPTLSDLWT